MKVCSGPRVPVGVVIGTVWVAGFSASAQEAPVPEDAASRAPPPQSLGTESRPDSGGCLLVHAPPPADAPSGFAVRLSAAFEGVWRGTRLEARVRGEGSGGWEDIPFLRDEHGVYHATIPAGRVVPPGLSYFIESVEEDGSRVSRFASSETPYFLSVRPSDADMVARRLERHGNRRSMVSLAFSYLPYGTESREYDQKEYKLKEYYNHIEMSYTYRFLQDEIYSIAFGFGLLGGKVGARSPDRLVYDHPDIPAKYKPGERPPLPGVYYGFGSAYWEVIDLLGVEPRVIMGASHRGFEGGGGITLRVGTVTKTHFDLGFEGISHVGYKVVTEFAWDTVPYVLMSLRNEITTYPYHGRRAAVPSFNVTGRIPGGWEVAFSVGYGARRKNVEGGLCLGGGIRANF